MFSVFLRAFQLLFQFTIQQLRSNPTFKLSRLGLYSIYMFANRSELKAASATSSFFRSANSSTIGKPVVQVDQIDSHISDKSVLQTLDLSTVVKPKYIFIHF